MLTGLSETKKAAIFSALVLAMALGAALLIRALSLPNGLRSSALYMFVPAAATLLMLLVVTRDGYTEAGWKSLGLHRAGLRAWGIAIAAPMLVSVVGTAFVWTTPIASFVLPDDTFGTVIGFFVQLVIFTLTLSWVRSWAGGDTCCPDCDPSAVRAPCCSSV